MTLSLVFAQRAPAGRPVIFADPGGGCTEAILAGLIPELGAVSRVMLPPRDDASRPTRPPAATERRWYADVWATLSADERARIVLVAGSDAAYLAPLIGSEARAMVFLPQPKQSPARVRGTWQSVTGPFPELDEIPEEVRTDEERDSWMDTVRAATANLELRRGPDIGLNTEALAAALDIGPQRAERAAAEALTAIAGRTRETDRRPHWIDGMLYSISPEPRRFENEQLRREQEQAELAAEAADRDQESVPAAEPATNSSGPAQVM